MNLVLGYILIALLFTFISCTSHSDDDNSRIYIGLVIDAVTSEPIAAVSVRLDHYLVG